MKRKSVKVGAAVLLAALLLAGCSARNEAADYSTGYSMPSEPQMESGESGSSVTYDASYALSASAKEAMRSEAAGEQYGGRKVILTYEIRLETDTFDSLLTALKERLETAGGYLQSSYIDGKKPEIYGDSGRTATLSLRVPAAGAEAFFSDVKAMGTVQSEQAYTDDVTAEYFDRETRLEVLNMQLERLKSILVETDNLAAVIALETEIARVTMEIEALTGELRRYDALIEYTTIDITVYETVYREGPAAAKTVGERIEAGFSDSLNGVGVFFVDAFVWFVSALPVLLVLVAVVAVVLLCVRAVRKRRKARTHKNGDDGNKLYEENKQ